MAIVSIVTWLISGLFQKGLWPQLACFTASVYLMVELNNGNALLRIRSRMVSSTFIVLMCMCSFLFNTLSGAAVLLCVIAQTLILFTTYQNARFIGRIYYAFLCIGVASLLFVQSLYFVPVILILMATQLQSLSGRGLLGAVLGLLTPYWFALLWLVYMQDFTPLADHFTNLLPPTSNLSPHTIPPYLGHWAAIVYIVVLLIAGAVHFWQKSYEDSIRIRLLYGYFITMAAMSMLLTALQPQFLDIFLGLSIFFSSPVIAHFLTFTRGKLSNIIFIIVTIIAAAIIVLNLWMPSFNF